VVNQQSFQRELDIALGRPAIDSKPPEQLKPSGPLPLASPAELAAMAPDDATGVNRGRSVGSVQRTIGNSRVSQFMAHERANPTQGGVIQRQEAPGDSAATPEVTSPDRVTFEGPFGTVQLGTHAELAVVGRYYVAQFQGALANIGPNENLRQRIEDWIAWTQAELPSLDEEGEQFISSHLAIAARFHLKNAVEIARAIAIAEGEKASAKGPARPGDLEPGQYHVVIVGSPGQAEVNAKHPYQFADAAARRGTGPNTVWLVEETGYGLGGVPLSGVRSRAGASRVFLISPSTPLASLLRQFPAGSIASLEAYSHGLPGLLALRHGWPGQDDYGLTTSEARGLSPGSFSPEATLSFDSCNSATEGDGESLAQAVATATQRPVQGWVGRTSYREVNRGAGGVVASEIWPTGGSFDWTELASQLRGRHPEQVTIAPASSPGDFSGSYEITARLPRTRRFPVGSNQRVLLTISAFSDIPTMQGLSIFVLLHREVDEDVGPPRRFAIGSTAVFEWQGLTAGTYYFEIYHLHGPLVTGDISVAVAD
jgi:hypothetical protein